MSKRRLSWIYLVSEEYLFEQLQYIQSSKSAHPWIKRLKIRFRFQISRWHFEVKTRDMKFGGFEVSPQEFERSRFGFSWCLGETSCTTKSSPISFNIVFISYVGFVFQTSSFPRQPNGNLSNGAPKNFSVNSDENERGVTFRVGKFIGQVTIESKILSAVFQNMDTNSWFGSS